MELVTNDELTDSRNHEEDENATYCDERDIPSVESAGYGVNGCLGDSHEVDSLSVGVTWGCHASVLQ